MLGIKRSYHNRLSQDCARYSVGKQYADDVQSPCFLKLRWQVNCPLDYWHLERVS